MGLFDFLKSNKIREVLSDIPKESQSKGPEGEDRSDFFPFLKELAKYYMDFLETDFHKRKRPRRYVRYHDDKNPDFKIGLNLNKYPKFSALIWKVIANQFEDDSLAVPKGRYRMEMPARLHELVLLQIDRLISEDSIIPLIDSISDKIVEAVGRFPEEYDKALEMSIEHASLEVKKALILPLVNQIEKPIQNMKLGDENTIFLMEEELTEAVISLLEENTAEVVRFLLAQEQVDVTDSLRKCLQLDDLKTTISSFFESLQFSDLYAEIFEIDRCKNIQENKEFYLYFYDIKFGGVLYPVFYIPLSVETEGQRYTITFDSQVFINKKALEYITQEFNRDNNSTGSLKSIRDRIIYLSDSTEDLLQKLGSVLDDICNLFELDGMIPLQNATPKTVRNMSIQLSSSCYIVLFDKADEALINDYEELLNLTSDSKLVESFSRITQEFISEDPKNYNELVDDEWDKTEIKDKLVVQCPIPLNSEQRCILSALNKGGTRIVTVEGPPGTGKSHTITAVVFKAILQSQSVLVLSDKKEALDVVEDKITETMNSVRHDNKFQNPILRLGKSKNTYSDILSPSSITQINNFYRAIRSNHDSLQESITKLSEGLKNGIDEEISAYGEIDIKDISELHAHEIDLPEKNCPIVVSEALQIPDSAVELQEFRNIFHTLNDRVTFDNDFHFSILTKISQENVAQLQRLIEILDALEKSRIPEITGEQVVSFLHAIQTEAGEGFHRDIHTINNFLSVYHEIISALMKKKAWIVFECEQHVIDSFEYLDKQLMAMVSLSPIIEKIQSVFSDDLHDLAHFRIAHDFDVELYNNFINEYGQLKGSIFGFMFRGDETRELDLNFKKTFPYLSFKKPHKHFKILKRVGQLFQYALELKNEYADQSSTTPEYLSYVIESIKSDMSEETKELQDYFEHYQTELSSIRQLEWLGQVDINSFELLIKVKNLAQFLCICDKLRAMEVEGIDHILQIDSGLYDFLLTSDLSLLSEKVIKHKQTIDSIVVFQNDVEYLREHLPKYGKTMEAAGINPHSFTTLCQNGIAEMSEDAFDKIIRYISLWQQIKEQFECLPFTNYGNTLKLIEQLVTAQMTYILDGRVLDFYNNSKNTAKTLRQIIRGKQRFPKEEFSKLKEAFPCILASVRDYAEYIPLLPEIFDLVIIDEASQVSIAQAFPALLRGKKILILGDNKQFSNIKAAQARGDINKEYMNNLKDKFRKCVSKDQTKLVKLDKFNIKTSILDFSDFIANYKVQLQKHFRCYKELISYSNSIFYGGSLQVMKIRGKKVDEVLKFSIVPCDDKKELIPKTNSLEVDFILTELKKLVAQGNSESIGVITPHTNQQKLIYQQALQLPESQELFDRHRLKVMTFDTCQGEERDIIFYSMVATSQDDRLGYIFPKDLENIDFESDGRIRVQRLNVGFSRTKECMHFVLSKDVSQYTGAIGKALKHYDTVLTDARKEHLPSEVDSKSPMEASVLNWFYQTQFWKRRQATVEIIPQFPIGDYLKQLDRTYDHPKYRVDFLLLYYDGSYEHKVIIEYDGLKEHFTDIDAVNEFNYQHFYRDDDVYREKVLEGYGYRFLRINRFNLGNNPVETLDERLEKLVERRQVDNDFLTRIHSTISQLENGQMKECPKCKEVKPKKKFYDSTLATNYGRICIDCKGMPKRTLQLKPKGDHEAVAASCPQCGSRMVLRNGRYGYFYGCTHYPYCKGTRNST